MIEKNKHANFAIATQTHWFNVHNSTAANSGTAGNSIIATNNGITQSSSEKLYKLTKTI